MKAWHKTVDVGNKPTMMLGKILAYRWSELVDESRYWDDFEPGTCELRDHLQLDRLARWKE